MSLKMINLRLQARANELTQTTQIPTFSIWSRGNWISNK